MADPTPLERHALRYHMFGDERSQTRDLSDKIVETRKPHICVICQETFPAGSRARALRQIDLESPGDRRVMTFYACPTCVEAMAQAFDDEHPDHGAAITARCEIGARAAEGRER